MRIPESLLLMVCLPVLVQAQPGSLQLDSTRLEINVLAEGLVIPYDLVWAPDSWIWFTQRAGEISRIHPNTGEVQLIHTVEEVFQSTDNSGMYALALHPEFPIEPWVYVHYTYELFASRLVRFRYEQTCGCLRDSTHLIPYMLGHESHNGSRIEFGPDGMLYLTTGDAYVPELAQDLNSLNGKILRMHPDGRIPADNPWPDSYVWTFGHRNPQGLVFLPSGALFSSEHGGGRNDELNRIEAGQNYGWPRVSGLCDVDSEFVDCQQLEPIEPLRIWHPSNAPGGLAYYDHPAIPEWRGALLQAFLKHKDGSIGQRLEVQHLDATEQFVEEVDIHLAHSFGRLRDVLVAPDGRVFISTSNREWNGRRVVQPGDDKILELYNPDVARQGPTGPKHLLISPQPVSDRWRVEVPGTEGPVRVRISDALGRIWRSTELEPGPTAFYMEREALPAGWYYLEAIQANGQRWGSTLWVR
ncbi:MAG: PQQ-dependent sugar dehydrogenase [Bacteroidota bacterium]